MIIVIACKTEFGPARGAGLEEERSRIARHRLIDLHLSVAGARRHVVMIEEDRIRFDGKLVGRIGSRIDSEFRDCLG